VAGGTANVVLLLTKLLNEVNMFNRTSSCVIDTNPCMNGSLSRDCQRSRPQRAMSLSLSAVSWSLLSRVFSRRSALKLHSASANAAIYLASPRVP